MSVKPLSMSALIYLIRDKAKKGWSEKDFPDMRLLIAASIPQLGATASTFLLEPSLRVDEMNAQALSNIGTDQIFRCLSLPHDVEVCLRMDKRD
jgi:hypothetical protein